MLSQLAPQFVLSCNSTHFTCNGGWPATVMDWMNKNSATNICCMPFNQGNGGNIVGSCPMQGQCEPPQNSKSAYPASGVVSVVGPSSPFIGCTNPPARGNVSQEA